MKVFIGADHRGFAFKQKIVAMLEQLGHKVIDLGTYTDQQPCDYPDIAKEVGEHVAKERDARGILVCMSGIGLTIAANKIKGVYAALCYNLESAELSRLHNNANVLVLSAKFIEEKDLFQMLETWMTTNFEGGRHLARVKKIMDMEEGLPAVAQPKVAAPVKTEDKPSFSSKERIEKSERPDRENSDRERRPYSSDRPERSERPRSSDREGRPAYTTRKPPFRKDAERSYAPAKKSFVGERSYARPERSDSRSEGRPSYASRRPDSRTGSDRGERPSYSGGRPDRDSRPRSPDRGPRRDEGRPSYGSKPSYGTKKPYSSERSYAKPGRPDSRSNDSRPSYASRKPDGRGLSERQRPAYAKDRSDSRPSRDAGRSERPRVERSDRGERKPFSSGKPKFSSKPGGKTFAGKKKFSKS